MLDLGVWASLQSIVEQAHRIKRCHLDALMMMVFEACNTGRLDGVIGNAFHRLGCVSTLINEGRGDNDRVKDKIGVKFEEMKFDFNKNMTSLVKRK